MASPMGSLNGAINGMLSGVNNAREVGAKLLRSSGEAVPPEQTQSEPENDERRTVVRASQPGVLDETA